MKYKELTDILVDQNLLTNVNAHVDFSFKNYLGKAVEGQIENITGVIKFTPWDLEGSFVNILLPMTGLNFSKLDDKSLLNELMGSKEQMLDTVELNFGGFIDLGERYVAKGDIEIGGKKKEVLLFVYYKIYEATRVLRAELRFSKPVYKDEEKGLLFENVFQLNIVVNLDA